VQAGQCNGRVTLLAKLRVAPERQGTRCHVSREDSECDGKTCLQMAFCSGRRDAAIRIVDFM
jgi:hypothetical protein